MEHLTLWEIDHAIMRALKGKSWSEVSGLSILLLYALIRYCERNGLSFDQDFQIDNALLMFEVGLESRNALNQHRQKLCDLRLISYKKFKQKGQKKPGFYHLDFLTVLLKDRTQCRNSPENADLSPFKGQKITVSVPLKDKSKSHPYYRSVPGTVRTTTTTLGGGAGGGEKSSSCSSKKFFTQQDKFSEAWRANGFPGEPNEKQLIRIRGYLQNEIPYELIEEAMRLAGDELVPSKRFKIAFGSQDGFKPTGGILGNWVKHGKLTLDEIREFQTDRRKISENERNPKYREEKVQGLL